MSWRGLSHKSHFMQTTPRSIVMQDRVAMWAAELYPVHFLCKQYLQLFIDIISIHQPSITHMNQKCVSLLDHIAIQVPMHVISDGNFCMNLSSIKDSASSMSQQYLYILVRECIHGRREWTYAAHDCHRLLIPSRVDFDDLIQVAFISAKWACWAQWHSFMRGCLHRHVRRLTGPMAGAGCRNEWLKRGWE